MSSDSVLASWTLTRGGRFDNQSEERAGKMLDLIYGIVCLFQILSRSLSHLLTDR